MMRSEMAVLLAKVQLGDNRHVDGLVLDYWMDTIGDLDIEAALDALRRFRRERPGTYLEPGHLLELAGVVDEQPSPIPDVTAEVLAESRRLQLEAAGVTEDDVKAHADDPAWLAAHFPARQVEAIEAVVWPVPLEDDDA